MNTARIRVVLIAAALALVQAAAQAESASIAAALAHQDRPAADRAEDATRQPQQVLAFLDVRPGQRVMDAFSAGGYYTELLSRIVGPKGEVLAYNNRPYFQFGEKAIAQRYAGNRLQNVRQITASIEALKLRPSSLDSVIFVMAYHDLYWRPADGSWAGTDPIALLRKLHAALKRGGVVLVQDHAAAPGGDPTEVVNRLHRIDPARVRADFEAAGFVFDSASTTLAHPEDDRTRLVFDPTIRGRTDQFLLRFRRS